MKKAKDDPFAGIASGAALCCALLLCGCTTQRQIEYDAQHPAVRVSTTDVYFGDRVMSPEDVPARFDSYGVPRTSTIHIRIDPDVKDLRRARLVMAYLRRAGYTRPVLVTERHAEAINLGKKKFPDPGARR